MAAPIPHTDIAGMDRPAGRLDLAGALQPYRGQWNERLAAHLLRRAGFGGTASQVAALAGHGMDGAVDSLLVMPDAAGIAAPDDLYNADAQAQQLFPGGRPKAVDDMQRRAIFKQIRMGERRSILALQNWWLNRMLTTPAPLQEKMALYFHGHFTTASIQKNVGPVMTFDQNQLFRANALGNLRDLTWKVSIDPAMLIYLDNARNLASHPNENYARELMELFTLGVDHYTEEDVRQGARAWTGWIVDRRSGQARFIPRRHDSGTKTYLGQTGNWTGSDVVNMIFRQPACATFFAGSLLNYFVYNNPEPELVEAVASLLRTHDYELRPVLSTLLRSNLFYSARAYRALVKSPVEFVVGTHQAFGLPQIGALGQRALVQMAQILFEPPNVAGWPGGANWLTSQTLLARENFVAGLVNSQEMQTGSWLDQIPMQASEAASQLVHRILYDDASPSAFAQLAEYLDGAGTSALGTLSGENYQLRVRGAAYLTMAMPAYQLA